MEQNRKYEAELWLDPEGNRKLGVRGDSNTEITGSSHQSARLVTHFFDEQPVLYNLNKAQLEDLIEALQNLRDYAEPEPWPPF